MSRRKDLTGMTFGRWTAIEFAGTKKYKTSTAAQWKCRCECGTERIVSANSLTTGKSISCGCYSREIHKEVMAQANRDNAKHGMFGTRIYRIWCGMKARCSWEKHSAYRDYGGRGIRVCDSWENNFEAFYEWAMANGYTDELTIDRKDVNGNYEPGNCKWATMSEQRRNQRSKEQIKRDRQGVEK